MKFVQIMEVTTDKFDEFEALHERWLAATEGERTTELEWVLRDRDNPNRYVIVVQFDSFAFVRYGRRAVCGGLFRGLGAFAFGVVFFYAAALGFGG